MTTVSNNTANAASGPVPQQFASLTNMGLAAMALERALGRHGNLPGLVLFYGPAGYGKTIACWHCIALFNAVYLEASIVWTQKGLLRDLAEELGIVAPARNTAGLLKQVIDELRRRPRPLIIDETDRMLKTQLVEVVREIHDNARVPVLLVGEEALPFKLQEWERFHSRILDFVAAVPADLEDCRKLARCYAPELVIADDLLEHFRNRCHGSVRRVHVNIDAARDHALREDRDSIDRAWWGDRPVYTGQAPSRIETPSRAGRAA